MPIAFYFYLASLLGACTLALLLPKGRSEGKGGISGLSLIGMILGTSTLGGLWLWLAGLPEAKEMALLSSGLSYYYVFSFISIAGAVRVITHTKPVYAALWFVMVVLASAGLFLILSAEFIAFAMLIIYGGAILVTYMFVIMLAAEGAKTMPAQEAASPDNPQTSYEKVSREPIAASCVGFFLLAILLTLIFPEGGHPNSPLYVSQSDSEILGTYLDKSSRPVTTVTEMLQAEAGEEPVKLPAMNEPAELSNTERVGLDLFQSHPLGLELAGIILLIALIGAVVIARQEPVPVEQEDPSQLQPANNASSN